MNDSYNIAITVKNEGGDPTKPKQPKTDTADKANEGTLQGTTGIAKQAIGMFPNGQEAAGIMNQAESAAGTAVKLSKGGAGAAALALSLVLKLAKEVRDFIIEYNRDMRQSKELQRRAGITKRG